MREAEWVENAGALTTIFGEWPSFHDSEVLTMHLDRSGEDGPTLEVQVHVFQMTREIDERGYFVLTNHTRVTLGFTNIVVRQLAWFNSQNVLSDLIVTEADPELDGEHRFNVSFESSYGVESKLLCDRIIVRSAEPFAPTQV